MDTTRRLRFPILPTKHPGQGSADRDPELIPPVARDTGHPDRDHDPCPRPDRLVGPYRGPDRLVSPRPPQYSAYRPPIFVEGSVLPQGRILLTGGSGMIVLRTPNFVPDSGHFRPDKQDRKTRSSEIREAFFLIVSRNFRPLNNHRIALGLALLFSGATDPSPLDPLLFDGCLAAITSEINTGKTVPRVGGVKVANPLKMLKGLQWLFSGRNPLKGQRKDRGGMPVCGR